MGRKEQAKGRRAELELCRVLNDLGFTSVRPGVAVSFGVEPDVLGLDGFHVEIKRRERIEISAWMRQAEQDSQRFKNGAPVVMFRRNREPWRVCMNLSDWLTLYKSYNEGSIEDGT